MVETLTCPHCGETFTCDPQGDCWCKAYPLVDIPQELQGQTCLCRCVLERLRRQKDGGAGPDDDDGRDG